MLELTLDEAIKHCKENVQKETQNGNLQCAAEHNQLAIWLSQLEESKSKAAAYDRLMSGGKKTLKEWANIFNRPMVVTQSRLIALACRDIPEIRTTKQLKHEYSDWIDPKDLYGEYVFFIPIEYIDFSGDWKDSLTLPDGWEEK